LSRRHDGDDENRNIVKKLHRATPYLVFLWIVLP
jgi:hypothetical protein